MEYCKASPDSKEWQAYQTQRVRSIKKLKIKNSKFEKQIGDEEMTSKTSNGKIGQRNDPITETSKAITVQQPYASKASHVPAAILKKVTKRTFDSQSKDASNVTWKEPLADTKFLPVGWMKVPEVPQSRPHQEQKRSHKKVLIRNKISSIEESSSAKRKSEPVSPGKQLSIIRERSGKNGKPHKRNNGKNNLTKPIITNAESEDSSSAAKVRKGGKLNNVERNTTTMNLEEPFKSNSSGGSIKSPTSTTAMKSLQEATTLPTTDGPSSLPGKSFLRQTLNKQESLPPPPPSSKKMDVKVEVPRKASEITHNQTVAVVTDNNNNSVLLEDITSAAEYWPIDIDHGKASSYLVPPPERKSKRNFNAHTSSSSSDETKWMKEEKTQAVDDVIMYSVDDKQDLNGNTIVCTPTRKQEKKSLENDSTLIATAKLLLGIDSKGKGTPKDNTNALLSKDNMHRVKVNEYVERKNNGEGKFDFQTKSVQKTQLETTNEDNLEDLRKKNMIASTLNRNQFELKKPFVLESMVELLNRYKPPKLPEFEVCNVLPGTPEWQKYWEYFNQKIGEYYSCLEKYSKQMDELLLDDDGFEYQKALQKRQEEETALKFSMGITIPKPPLIRQPLKDTVNIGGYVIRPLGGAVAQANVSTYNHSSFRLEIPCEKVDNNNLDSVTVDTKSNIMTVVIPSSDQKTGGSFMKIVQISVPKYKKVQNLQVGNPLDNGGKIIISGK